MKISLFVWTLKTSRVNTINTRLQITNMDTNSRTLEERITQLDLQVSTLNVQNNLMANKCFRKR